MALEWKDERESEIPAELLERLTAELFVSDRSREQRLHPGGALASAILGSSAEAEVNLQAGKVRFDRKGLAKLEKPVTAQAE